MPRKKKADSTEIMVVNDRPGAECRIAVLQDNHLEELYIENVANATNVGSIYKGRVTNVEPAIQAAFVDFGKGTSGFLHISDLHPRYFPGKERTERVGKKIPRRERPPIQEALRRGDEVLVQVLKQGLGTKGPTLTSYLSIPGRLMVLMPEMDRVGVTRKIEDDDIRRQMRKVLDGIDLPEGFGFILRTAGIGQTKTEIKRDVAYLMRLWKVMEKRINAVGAPCELFTESDLLTRTVRDVLRPSIKHIVVDSDSAYERVSNFLGVVAPRSQTSVIRYRMGPPIFHSFNIERQIDLIHSREVPLASGGKLVIDQTEACVAIDVNSGRSRGARDSETNAYNTNCEAVDEICRQLRLRDLGGLVINDLIDMYQHRHRRDIEERMKENLRRDRAKTTVLKISQFGIMEMTRQRMRPSLRSGHFVNCPICHGHGEVKTPETVGSEIVRDAACLLQYDRVARIEIVAPPRLATGLIRARRQLVEIEQSSGKQVEVVVRDAVNEVTFYAYDDRNADINVQQLPEIKIPTVSQLEKAEKDYKPAEELTAAATTSKSRRRRRKPGPADATAIALAGGFDEDDAEDESKEEGGKKRSRRRRRRRGGKDKLAEAATEAATAATEAAAEVAADAAEEQPAEARPARKSRRRRGRKRADDTVVEAVVEETLASADAADSIRVYVLAREIGVTSKDILERCEEQNVDVKNHMSSVKGEDLDAIRSWFGEGTDDTASTDVAPARSKSRRRGRRGRGGSKSENNTNEVPARDDTTEDSSEPGRRKKRRGGKRRRKAGEASGSSEETAAETESASRMKKKKTTRRRGASKPTEPAADAGKSESPDTSESKAEPKRRRSLYRNRKTVSPEAREAAQASL